MAEYLANSRRSEKLIKTIHDRYIGAFGVAGISLQPILTNVFIIVSLYHFFPERFVLQNSLNIPQRHIRLADEQAERIMEYWLHPGTQVIIAEATLEDCKEVFGCTGWVFSGLKHERIKSHGIFG